MEENKAKDVHHETILSSVGKPLEMRTMILMTTLTDSVCRINTGHHTGTGYMVRIPIGHYGDLYGMLTNHHVIGPAQLNSGRKWNLEFTAMDGLNYDWCSSDWVYVFTDPRLDCTFVVPHPASVEELDQRGIDFMPTGVERVGERVGVIQHPEGGELSFSYGKIVRMGHLDMYHNADTMTGSSGSPLINPRGEVIGLHKAWEADTNLNLATRISTVVDAIRSEFCNQPNLGIARKGGPYVNRDPRSGKIVTSDPALALRVSSHNYSHLPPEYTNGRQYQAPPPLSQQKPQPQPHPQPPLKPQAVQDFGAMKGKTQPCYTTTTAVQKRQQSTDFDNMMADLDAFMMKNFPVSSTSFDKTGAAQSHMLSNNKINSYSKFGITNCGPRLHLAPLRADSFGEALSLPNYSEVSDNHTRTNRQDDHPSSIAPTLDCLDYPKSSFDGKPSDHVQGTEMPMPDLWFNCQTDITTNGQNQLKHQDNQEGNSEKREIGWLV